LGSSQHTYGFETLHEFNRALVVFKVFDDVHYNVIVLKLAEILDHQLLDERLQFAIDQLLSRPKSAT